MLFQKAENKNRKNYIITIEQHSHFVFTSNPDLLEPTRNASKCASHMRFYASNQRLASSPHHHFDPTTITDKRKQERTEEIRNKVSLYRKNGR